MEWREQFGLLRNIGVEAEGDAFAFRIVERDSCAELEGVAAVAEDLGDALLFES